MSSRWARTRRERTGSNGPRGPRSRPGRRGSPSRSALVRTWRPPSRGRPSGGRRRRARCRYRRTGSATGSAAARSSSGRGAPIDSTTGCATNGTSQVTSTRSGFGGGSGSSREPGTGAGRPATDEGGARVGPAFLPATQGEPSEIRSRGRPDRSGPRKGRTLTSEREVGGPIPSGRRSQRIKTCHGQARPTTLQVVSRPRAERPVAGMCCRCGGCGAPAAAWSGPGAHPWCGSSAHRP